MFFIVMALAIVIVTALAMRSKPKEPREREKMPLGPCTRGGHYHKPCWVRDTPDGPMRYFCALCGCELPGKVPS